MSWCKLHIWSPHLFLYAFYLYISIIARKEFLFCIPTMYLENRYKMWQMKCEFITAFMWALFTYLFVSRYKRICRSFVGSHSAPIFCSEPKWFQQLTTIGNNLVNNDVNLYNGSGRMATQKNNWIWISILGVRNLNLATLKIFLLLKKF